MSKGPGLAKHYARLEKMRKKREAAERTAAVKAQHGENLRYWQEQRTAEMHGRMEDYLFLENSMHMSGFPSMTRRDKAIAERLGVSYRTLLRYKRNLNVGVNASTSSDS